MKQIDAGFDVDKAVTGAAEAAVRLNQEHNDFVDEAAVVQSVKDFIKNGPKEFKCKNCGWRQKNGTCPAHQNQKVGENDTCGAFLHVHEYVNDQIEIA